MVILLVGTLTQTNLLNMLVIMEVTKLHLLLNMVQKLFQPIKLEVSRSVILNGSSKSLFLIKLLYVTVFQSVKLVLIHLYASMVVQMRPNQRIR